MKTASNRKWLLVTAAVIAILFGQDVATAIFGPILTGLGSFIPAT